MPLIFNFLKMPFRLSFTVLTYPENLIAAPFCFAVLISLSSGMPNHSASIQVRFLGPLPSFLTRAPFSVQFMHSAWFYWGVFSPPSSVTTVFKSTHIYLFTIRFVLLLFTLKVVSVYHCVPILASHFLSVLQLCVQKLRILIEDSDQNCEPSVNACSVSFSHCLRVSHSTSPPPPIPF